MPAARLVNPKGLVIALAVTVLALVGYARLSGTPAETFDSPVQWSRALNFEDASNGDIAVIDPANGAVVARMQGEQGFARGVLRALTRERIRRNLGHEKPFLLQGHDDGSLTLTDTATDERIHLDSFGSAQRAVFARLQSSVTHSSDDKQGDKP
jgi:putative photosynthetic complex assembly protein